MNTVVISCGVGHWYPRGLTRQSKALRNAGYTGAIKHWSNEYPPNSETHQQLPYAFKPHAFQWADFAGYDIAIWMDCSVWPQKNITPIIDHVKQHGYLIFRNGWSTGNWSTDEQLEAFGLTREEAMQVPHAMACVVGLKLSHSMVGSIGDVIQAEYLENRKHFKGAWTNENGQVSSDPRVLGSRHDQTILSLIAHKYGLDFTPPEGLLSYDINDTNAILLAQGM